MLYTIIAVDDVLADSNSYNNFAVAPLAAETLNIFQKIRFLQVNVQPQSLTAFSQRVSVHH